MTFAEFVNRRGYKKIGVRLLCLHKKVSKDEYAAYEFQIKKISNDNKWIKLYDVCNNEMQWDKVECMDVFFDIIQIL